MKKLITLFAALAFSMLMLAQDTSQQGSSQSQSNQANQPQSSQSDQQATTGSAASNTNSGQRMSGKVSNDAKTFTEDTGATHRVSNPDALQNYENQHVVILVHADPDTGNLTITAVQPPQ